MRGSIVGRTLLVLLGCAAFPVRASEGGFPLELRLGLGWSRVDVSNQSFEGTHSLASSGSATTIRTTGAQAGYAHPSLFGAEVEGAVALSSFFHMGLVGAAAVAGGPDGTVDPGSPTRGGDLRMFSVAAAPGLRAELARAPIRFTLEARVGVRFESLPLLGVGMTSCSNASCTFDVQRTEFFVQPQLRADYRLGEGFAIGLYLGTDVAPRPFGVVSGGVHMAIDTGHF